MKTIAVVDDHQLFRIGVEAVLASKGLEVVASIADGEQALEKIAEVDPDLVLLDIRMPAKDGVATLQALRARGDKRKVIIMATDLYDEQLVAIMGVGVDAILFKHDHEDELFNAIQALREGRRYIAGELLDRAFGLALSSAAPSPIERLSARERQIAEAVAKGMRNREVGELLGMTEGTVKVMLHGIFNKMKVENRTELAVLLQSSKH